MEETELMHHSEQTSSIFGSNPLLLDFDKGAYLTLGNTMGHLVNLLMNDKTYRNIQI